MSEPVSEIRYNWRWVAIVGLLSLLGLSVVVTGPVGTGSFKDQMFMVAVPALSLLWGTRMLRVLVHRSPLLSFSDSGMDDHRPWRRCCYPWQSIGEVWTTTGFKERSRVVVEVDPGVFDQISAPDSRLPWLVRRSKSLHLSAYLCSTEASELASAIQGWKRKHTS